MPCKLCKTAPVIRLPNSEVQLCKACFIRYFEKKAKRTIKAYNLLDKKDRIAVACSGGKDSNALLFFLSKLSENTRNLELEIIVIDEGIKPYRDLNIQHLKTLSKNLTIVSFKKEFGLTLDEMIKIARKKKLPQHPCTICGVLRKYLLNKYARKLKVNKIATGHNLDDEAQSILMNQFRNSMETQARLGPLTGVIKDKKFIPRIKPFYLLTEKEIMTYAFLNNLLHEFTECPYSEEALRDDVRNLLNDYNQKHPGSKHAVINSFLEILPLLKNHYKTNDSKIKTCKKCKEPSSQDICQACNILKELK